MDTLRGVNLGGWLVLERWMTPAIFEGSDARDEYGAVHDGSLDAAARISEHRQAFITYDDLSWLASKGVNAVRLPLPYWLFGDAQPFIGCEKEVQWLLDTADALGLKVLLDLHAAPGSQNGNPHSGRAGAIRWTESDNIQQTLNMLSKLTMRFASHPAVWGIEVLNEPDYHIDHALLTDFYDRAISVIREHNQQVAIVISDAFRPRDWRGTPLARQQQVYLDMHLYQCYSEADKKLDIHKHIKKARQEWGDLIRDMQQTMPVIIGEWSVALDPRAYRGMDEFERDKAIRAYGVAQQDAFDQAAGWFYWSYKTEGAGAWNFRDAVSRGWMPSQYA